MLSLNLRTRLTKEQLFIVERTAWSDEAATAAEVTALQYFAICCQRSFATGRANFGGNADCAFYGLKNSTRLYREIGDATAFGQVMNHFDILKEVIAAHDGALVKTIGDRGDGGISTAFGALKPCCRCNNAWRIRRTAHSRESQAGLHVGPCIAVTLNERLDYFGSTVNLAARLEGQSTGDDIVISSAVYADPQSERF